MKISEYRTAHRIVDRSSDDLHRLISERASRFNIDIAQKTLDRAVSQFEQLLRNATGEERRQVFNELVADAIRTPTG